MWLFSLTASAAVNSASAPASAPTSVPIEPTQISVVDQNNNPLANAVIEYTSPPSVEQDSNSNQGADSNKDTTYIMDQIDKQFVPYVLIVPQNNLVSFPNSDDIRHHVYSFSPTKKFELKLYSGRPKQPLLFDQHGIVTIGCNIHDAMVGYIYVSNTTAVKTNLQGKAPVLADIGKNVEIKIWHPNQSKGLNHHKEITLTSAMIANKEAVFIVDITKPEPRNSFEELNFDDL